MTLEEALALVAGQRLGALVTPAQRPATDEERRVRGADQQVLVSLTEGRAKTRNPQRDPRATLHVSAPDMSAWAPLEGTAELSPVTTRLGDATGQALTELYTAAES